MFKLLNEKAVLLFTTFLCFIMTFQVNISNAAGIAGAVPQGPITAEPINSIKDPAIRDVYTDLFASQVYHLSQQQGSVLMPYVKMEGMVSAAKSINRQEAQSQPSLYTSRNSQITASNPDQDVRWIVAQRYWKANFIENWDQIRTIWNIQSAFLESMYVSFGRQYDRIIIGAGLGKALVGPDKNYTTSLPSTQKIVSHHGADVATDTTLVGLNLNTIKKVRKHMKRTFAVRKNGWIVMAITASETDSLLNETQTTSRDFSNILSLVNGEISSFYGFIFVETELMPYTEEITYYNKDTGALVAQGTAGALQIPAGQAHRCMAFTMGDSICFGTNMNLLARTDEIPLLHYNIMVYLAMEVGATRIEEVKVMEVRTYEPDGQITIPSTKQKLTA